MADSADSTRAPADQESEYQRSCRALKHALEELARVKAGGAHPLWDLDFRHAVDREFLQRGLAIVIIVSNAIRDGEYTQNRRLLSDALDGARMLLGLEAAAAIANDGE